MSFINFRQFKKILENSKVKYINGTLVQKTNFNGTERVDFDLETHTFSFYNMSDHYFHYKNLVLVSCSDTLDVWIIKYE